MKYRKSLEVLTSKIDDEVIIMSIDADSYFGLNDVGSRAWELLDEPATFEELVALLRDEYEVDEDTCREDLQSFLDNMMARNLILAEE